MAGRGPAPTPSALRLIRGNPGKRAMPKGEPKAKVGPPPKPDCFGVDASAEWDRIVPLLSETRVLTRNDLAALTAYCVQWGRMVECERGVWAPRIGERKKAILRRRFDDAMKLMRWAAQELGLTPAARTRIRVDAGEAPKDEATALLGY